MYFSASRPARKLLLTYTLKTCPDATLVFFHDCANWRGPTFPPIIVLMQRIARIATAA